MKTQRVGRVIGYAVSAMIVAVGVNVDNILAQTPTSPNYQLTETQFGGGSTLESCSGQYCATVSIGDTSIGDAEAGNSTARFGAITDSDPLLEVIIDPGESNLGVLSTETTATKTTTIRIRTHLSSGYILQIIGEPPKFDGHSMNTPNQPTASSPGLEQFGINLVANTLPNVGNNPVQVPSSSTSFGEVEENYANPNEFMYTSEDVVARSMSESGRTDYTISMIVNISSGTPAGHYAGDFSAVVIPVY